jgi:predicted  nucleic acid-binding Zn-ribbon protein
MPDRLAAGDDVAELERLRRLVGPSETSYAALRRDVDHARDAAREAELAAGSLRGELAEMRVALARARQDQDRFQRRREMSAAEHLADLAREAWTEILRPRVARLARAVGLRR